MPKYAYNARIYHKEITELKPNFKLGIMKKPNGSPNITAFLRMIENYKIGKDKIKLIIFYDAENNTEAGRMDCDGLMTGKIFSNN